MPKIPTNNEPRTFGAVHLRAMAGRVLIAATLASLAGPVFAEQLSRSVDVTGTPASVWSVIGPFCAIKDWHPAIESCVLDNKRPATRTLVTRQGHTRFVELFRSGSDMEHRYSYAITSSPLPVTNYASTVAVVAKSANVSTVTWSSTYVPEKGQEANASAALIGIYESGLDAIKARLAK